MRRFNLVADGRNEPIGNRAPRTIGSSASRLMRLIDGSHYDAKLSDEERKTVRLWIDASAPYAGTYASLGCGVYPVRLPMPVLMARCISCHGQDKGKLTLDGYRVEAACNLDRPEKSLLVRAPLAKAAGGLGICQGAVFADTEDADYQKLVEAIRIAGGELAAGKRFDMPGFRPNRYYIREMQRFGFLSRPLPPEAPIDSYATDEAYWRSFWWQPAGAE